MNKTELINKIAEKTSLEKTKVTAVVNAFMDSIVETLAKHESVTLIGFGTFKTKARKKRNGVNPKTGKSMVIPATVVPAMSFGSDTKTAVKTKKIARKFLVAAKPVAKKATVKPAAKKVAAKPVAKKAVAKKVTVKPVAKKAVAKKKK